VAKFEGPTLRAWTAHFSIVVVPPVRFMPPASAERLRDLAHAGGRVVFIGDPPQEAPGIQDREARTARLREALAALDRLGGAVAHVPTSEAAVAQVTAAVPPAFRIVRAGDGSEAAGKAARETVGFVQRREAGGATLFFIANVSSLTHDLRVQLDAGHRRPERWDLLTGDVDDSVVYESVSAGGRKVTEVALHLPPFASCVVAFGDRTDAPRITRTDLTGPVAVAGGRGGLEVSGLVDANGRRSATSGAGKTAAVDVTGVPSAIDIAGPWTLALGDRAPVALERLRSWDALPEGKAYSGWAAYETEFDAPPAEAGVTWLVDLGEVHETAEVVLNGVPLGAAWKAPRQLSCGDALRAGRNRLKVLVANLWIHAMAARQPPPDWKVLEETVGIRWGRYGEVPPEKLPPAGLLGPVRLVPRKRITVLVR
jgi:hypothetical protein